MTRCLVPITLCLFAGFLLPVPAPAASFCTTGDCDPGAPRLPSGGVFHERMLEWDAPAPPARTGPVSQRRTALAPPVGTLRLSSGFGSRRDPIRRTPATHAGLDIPGAIGSPVYASESGVIVRAGRSGGYGNMIEIDHGGGLRTRYAHLSRLLIAPRASVRQGQVIGLMGSTGRSTGSHLHFEVRLEGRPADPLPFLRRVQRFGAPVARAPMERFVSAFAAALAAAPADDRPDTLPSGHSRPPAGPSSP
jgi:murein DD-endopeptidase MepM/ murein hydrolase activator NlpD